jgi:hypothetical protein
MSNSPSSVELSFHLQEHEHVRREIEADKNYLRKLGMYVVIGTGTVWSWILIDGESLNTVQRIAASSLPVLFTLFGAWQTRGLISSIELKAEYVREIESAMARLPDLEGWETWWATRRTQVAPRHGLGKLVMWLFLRRSPHRQDWVFWTVMTTVTALAPVIFFWANHPQRNGSASESLPRVQQDTPSVTP